MIAIWTPELSRAHVIERLPNRRVDQDVLTLCGRRVHWGVPPEGGNAWEAPLVMQRHCATDAVVAAEWAWAIDTLRIDRPVCQRCLAMLHHRVCLILDAQRHLLAQPLQGVSPKEDEQ